MALEDNPLSLELPLRVARVHDSDAGVQFIEQLPVVLKRYPQITVSDFWNLTVAELLALVADA